MKSEHQRRALAFAYFASLGLIGFSTADGATRMTAGCFGLCLATKTVDNPSIRIMTCNVKPSKNHDQIDCIFENTDFEGRNISLSLILIENLLHRPSAMLLDPAKESNEFQFVIDRNHC